MKTGNTGSVSHLVYLGMLLLRPVPTGTTSSHLLTAGLNPFIRPFKVNVPEAALQNLRQRKFITTIYGLTFTNRKS